jgi:hypothetical protein
MERLSNSQNFLHILAKISYETLHYFTSKFRISQYTKRSAYQMSRWQMVFNPVKPSPHNTLPKSVGGCC